MTRGAPLTVTSTTRQDDRETLLREVARSLHAAGAPAHRLEQTVDALARRLGLPARIFSTPTAIYAGFGPEDEARTVLLRVQRASLDLGRLADVDALTRRILAGELAADRAVEQLHALSQQQPRFGPAWQVPGYGVSAAAATVLLGGGLAEVLASAMVGVIVGLFVIAAADRPQLSALIELGAGLLAAIAAGAWARGVMPIDAGIVTIAALIVLVPGLTLTTALTELATHHLVSGTARLAGAGVTFASLGLGAMAGAAIMQLLPDVQATPIPVPEWGHAIAWAAAVLAFTPLMQTRLVDVPLFAVSTAVGMLALRVGGDVLPPALAAAVGALCVALVSNLLARVTDRPAAVALVPGLFLLVPGSVGFRGLVELLDSNLDSGLHHLVGAVLTAAALAAGVIIAQAMAPPRRAL